MEIPGFSTSAVDLLSCGLAAMLVLWVLVLGNERNPLRGVAAVGNGSFVLSQFDVFHVLDVKIDTEMVFESLQSRGVPEVLLQSSQLSQVLADCQLASSANRTECHFLKNLKMGAALGSIKNEIDINLRSMPKGPKEDWTVTYSVLRSTTKLKISKDSAGEFAGRVRIDFVDVDRPITLRIGIETCTDSNNFHRMILSKVDGRGLGSPETVIFQVQKSIVSVFKQPQKGKHDLHWSTVLKTDPSSRALVHFVGPDRMSVDNIIIKFGKDGLISTRLPQGVLELVEGAPIMNALTSWAKH